MMAKKILTQDRLKEILKYYPESGNFIRILSCAPNAQAGQLAGYTDARGYRVVGIDGSSYKLHRIAFLYMNGEMPPSGVDHIDGDKENNSWSNLRLATQQENSRNKKIYKRNTSGVNGVSWCKRSEKWVASIRVSGKTKHIGYYSSLDDAAAQRGLAEKKYGFHPNHGRRA